MVVNLIGFNVAYALLIVTAPQIDPSLNQQRVECMKKAMEVNHYIITAMYSNRAALQKPDVRKLLNEMNLEAIFYYFSRTLQALMNGGIVVCKSVCTNQ